MKAWQSRHVSNYDAEHIVSSFIALLSSGCIDQKDEEIRGQLELAKRLIDDILS